MSKLKIVRRQNKNVCILDLEGTIKIGDDSLLFRTNLRSLIRDGEKNILLNLKDVTYIDSSGLGELVSGFSSLQKNGGDMKLLNLTDRVSELMMITKLLTVFEIYDDEKTAIDSFEKAADHEGLDESALVAGTDK